MKGRLAGASENVRGEGDLTDDEDPNGEIPPPEHPERPGPEPAMPSAEGERDDRVLEDRAKDRSVVSLNNSSDRDGELPVVQLAKTDVDGVLNASSQ